MKQQVDNLKNKKVIGFDMDGVIIDHSARKVALAKKMGFKIKRQETPSDIIKDLIPEPEYKKLQFMLYNDPKASLSSSLMSGVKPALSRLQKNGTPFFLISRRQEHGLSKKLLAKHELWPKYFNEENTFFVKEVADKEKTAKKLGITHYIDDEQKVLDALVSVKNKFLFDPLEAFKNPPKYWRIKSWKEILRLI